MTEVTEYKPKFAVGSKIEFNFNEKKYKGVVSNVWIKNGTPDKNAVSYGILSNNILFQKHEDDIRLYTPEDGYSEITHFVGHNTRFELSDGKLSIVAEAENETPLEEGETFSTESGNDFSIFRHYEDDDNGDPLIHIELSENDIWSKSDVWELVAELLNAVDEIDRYVEDKPATVININEKIENEQLYQNIKRMIYQAFEREHTGLRYNSR